MAGVKLSLDEDELLIEEDCSAIAARFKAAFSDERCNTLASNDMM